MASLTREQVNNIEANIKYNYTVIERVLNCLSLKPKLLHESQNEFVGVMIDEALNQTLMERIYDKDANGIYQDTLGTKDGVSAQLLLDEAGRLFDLPIEVLKGDRKINLGIEFPDELKLVKKSEDNLENQSFEERKALEKAEDDKFKQAIIDFNKRHPEWAVEMFATDMGDDESIKEAVRHILRDRKLYKKAHENVHIGLDELLYNPLGIDGIKAFLHVIDNGMVKFPSDIDSIFDYIDKKTGLDIFIREFIEQSNHGREFYELIKIDLNLDKVTDEVYEKLLADDTILKPFRNRERNNKKDSLMDDYEQFAVALFKQMFIYILFLQLEDTSRIVNKNVYKPTYKTNVYCLDSLIYYIADSTFEYLYGTKDMGRSIWRFLKQTTAEGKIDIELATLPQGSEDNKDDSMFELSGMEDYVFDEKELYERLTLAVPAPLKLSAKSELLRLILGFKGMYTISENAENKGTMSLNTTKRLIKPQFTSSDMEILL